MECDKPNPFTEIFFWRQTLHVNFESPVNFIKIPDLAGYPTREGKGPEAVLKGCRATPFYIYIISSS
jgi:hypothetical protein